MRYYTRFFISILIVSIIGIACITNASAQKSISGMQNISELLTTAQQNFDMSKQDAVLLFDGQKIHWLPDGRLVTYIHRIIWINSKVAIDAYGDHRIPYDSERCTFNVVTIRTWRDGQWWETGETGIVETLPFALKKAYDYSNIREMMLLHDGIELPCILEVAYYIEDKEPFRNGAEGLWTFARQEPAVQSWFIYGLPTGLKPNVFTSMDVPEPVINTDPELGLNIYWWKMGPIEAIGRPPIDDPALEEPYIAWSTWLNWKTYGHYIYNPFKEAMKLDEPIEKSLDSLLIDARTDAEQADLIAKFIDKKTRLINYTDNFWLTNPRQASQTYASAYGHRLDRAVLAAAMFSHAGIESRPVFLGKGHGNIDVGTPTLSRMTDIGVWISGDDLEAYYNPASSKISNGPANIYNRTVWLPHFDDNPNLSFASGTEYSSLDIRIDLAFDSKKDLFTGKGYLYVDKGFNPYDRMTGLANESKSYLGSVVSGLLKGAKITGYNLSNFDRLRVSVGFELELKKPEPDDFDRLELVLDEPSGGIFDNLPRNVHLYDQKRSSRVDIPFLMNQKIELKLDLEGLEVVYSPADKIIGNSAGIFSVTVDRKDERLVITRKLNLTKTTYQPEDWPALRELLLADKHQRNQSLLLKTAEGGDEK